MTAILTTITDNTTDMSSLITQPKMPALLKVPKFLAGFLTGLLLFAGITAAHAQTVRRDDGSIHQLNEISNVQRPGVSQSNLGPNGVLITTSHTANNSSNSITFNFYNGNPYDVKITDISSMCPSAGSTNVKAFYKTTAIAGNPNGISVANGWSNFASATITANGAVQPFFTGLSLTVPAGATYGIEVESSIGQSYYNIGTTPFSDNFTAGGCTVTTGDNVGYAGALAPGSQPNHPRGFVGSIGFEPVGDALNFNGTSENVNLGSAVGNLGGGDFGIEFLLKTTQAANTYIISKRGVCNNDNFYNLVMDGNGHVGYELSDGAGIATGNGAAGPAVNDGQTHRISFTRNSGVVKLYVDGNVLYSVNNTANINNAYPTYINNTPCAGFGPQPLIGTIDDVRFWSRGLCQSEIRAHLFCELTLPQTGLKGYYTFNQGVPNGNNASQTSLTDDSGNGNTGTLTGFALTGTTSNYVDAITAGSCSAFTASAPVITAGGSTAICYGTTVTLTSDAQGTYQWNLGGVAIPGAATNTYVVNAPGSYTVTSDCGTVSAPTVVAYETTAPVLTGCPSNINANCGSVVTFTAPAATDNCSSSYATPASISGYTLLGDSAGHRYFISNATADWTTAKNAAIAAGGHLAAITSAAEDAFVYKKWNAIFPGSGPWIGGTDEAVENNFVWVSGEPFSYQHFDGGQPDDAGGAEDYIQYFNNGFWNDRDGGAQLQYIVEFDHGVLTVDQTAGLPSGSVFPVGTTTVTYIATDVAGNQSAPCSFNVVVTDTAPPVVTCPSNISVASDPNTCGAVVTFGSSTFALNIAGNYGDNSSFDYGDQTLAAPLDNVSGISFGAGSNAHGHSHSGNMTLFIDMYNPTTSAWVNAVTIPLVSGQENYFAGQSYTFASISKVSAIRFRSTVDQGYTYHEMGGIPTTILANGIAATDCSSFTVTQTAGLPSGSLYPNGVTTNTFTVTDANNNTSTCSFTVTVAQETAQVVQPSNQAACTGATIPSTTFSVSPAITGTPIYTWTNNNTAIGLAANGTGDVPAFTATNTTNAPLIATITVTASTSCAGSAGSPKTYTITVNPVPQLNQPANQGPLCNQTSTAVTFTTTNTGAGVVSYTWTNNNTSIGLGASGTGNISAFTVNNSSLVNTNVATITVIPHYTLNGTACDGASKTFTITVQPGSFGQITGAGNTQICAGTDGSININTGGVAPFAGHFVISVVSGPGTPTPSFGFNSPFAGGASIIVPAALLPNTSATPVIYKIQFLDLADGNGCNAVPLGGQVQITVNPLPVATATPAAQTICSKGTTSIVLSSTIVNSTYTYTAAVVGGPNPLVTGFSNCNANCGTIAQTLRNRTAVNQIVRYTIIPTSESAQGCQGPALTVDVTIQPEPVGVATPATATICSGAATSVALSNQIATGTTYTWTASNTSGGTVTGFSNCASGCTSPIAQTLVNTSASAGVVTYTIIPTSANGCAGDAFTSVITVNPAPVGTATPAASTICSKGTTSIALANQLAGTTYTWTASNTSGGTVTGFSNCASACGTTIAQQLFNTSSTAGVVTYIITPTSTNGCAGATFTATVTVNPQPVGVSSPATATICSKGTAIALLSTSNNLTGTTYTWTVSQTGGTVIFPTPGSGSTIIQTLTNVSSTAGVVTYTITPTSALGCVGATFTYIVTVNPEPIGVATPMVSTICSKGTATTTFSTSNSLAGTTYAWTVSQTGGTVTGATAGSGSSISQQLFNVSSTAGVVTYTVTPTSASGCVGATFTYTATVNPEPIGVATPATATICSKGTAATTFSASNSLAGTTYAWTVSQTGGTVSGATAAGGSSISQQLFNVSSTAGVVTYTVTPTSALGCVGATFTYIVTVNPEPVGVATPATATICSKGTAATAFSTSNSLAGTTYAWTVSQTGGAVTGATAGSGSSISQQLFNTSSTAGVVTYTVTPTSAIGCVGATFTYIVTVNPEPVGVATPATATICSKGTAATAFSTSNSLAGTTYAWTVSQTGGTVAGATAGSGSTISQVLTNVSSTAGMVTYTVTPTSALGCVGATFTYTVTVNPEPVGVSSPATATICSKGLALAVLSTSNNLVGTTYAWTVSQTGGTVTGATPGNGSSIPQTLTNVSSTAGVVTYTITPTSALGCVGAMFTYVVTVNPEPVGVASPFTATICSKGTATTAFSTSNSLAGTTYAWTVSQTGGTVTGATAGSGSSISQVLINVSGTAGVVTYTVTPTSALGCVGLTFTYTVTVNPEPVGVATPATATICSKGTAATAFSTSNSLAGTTYTWTVSQTGGTVTGATAGSGSSISQQLVNTSSTAGVITYTVTPTSALGCVGATFTYVVTVNPEPLGVATLATATICSKSTATTTFSTSNSLAGTTYAWTVSQTGGAVTGATAGSGASISQVLANVSGTAGVVTYTVTPTSALGCVGATFTYVVTVNPEPVGVATPSTATICSKGTAAATFSTSNSLAGTTYAWTVSQTGGAVTGATAGSGASISQVLANVSGTAGVVTYTVTPTSALGCVGATFTYVVTVNPEPVGVATPSTATICSKGTAAATFSTSNSLAGTTYAWTVSQTGGAVTGATAGSGASISQALTNVSGTAGVVTYTVTPTSALGCVGATFTYIVTVNPEPVGVATPATATICSKGTAATAFSTSNSLAGTTYAWTVSQTGGAVTGATAGSGASISQVLTNVSGTAGVVTYTVTPTSALGCVGATFTYIATVNPEPVGVATPATATICSKGTAATTFSTSNSLAGTTYTWTVSQTGGAVTGATTGSGSTISQVLTNVSGTAGVVTYTVTPTSALGCVGATFTYIVTVNSQPVGQATPAANTICSGGTAATSFSTTNGMNAGTTYAWTVSQTGGTITGATAGTGSSISQVLTNTSNTAGIVTYTVTPTSALGCTGSTFTYAVTVTQLPVLVATRVGTGDQCPGSNIVFNVTETNNGGGTFSWVAKDALNNVLGSATGVAYGNGAISTNLGLSCPVNKAVTFTFTPTGGTALACVGATVTAPVINVRNTVPPTFTFSGSLPTVLNVGAGAGCTVSMPDYRTFVTGISNCGGAVTLAQLAPNAPASPVIGYGGTRTIVIRGTDACGNIADTSFVINLVDQTAPVASCKTATVNLDASGNGTLTAAMVNNNSADNCSGVTLAISKSTFDCSNVGSNTVTLTVTDASGNSSTCTATVLVNDITAPVIQCFGDTTVAKGANCTNTLPDLTFRVTKSDACGFNPTGSVTQNIPAGTVIGASVTTLPVTLTVTDKNGNFSTCTFNVMFADQSAPIISSCGPVQTAFASASCAATVPNFTSAVTATDNCSGAAGLTITQSPAVGTIVTTGTTPITITVTDAAGNFSTCTTSFIVSDNTAPTITSCGPAQTANTNASCSATVPSFIGAVTASDNCTATGSLVITQSPAAGTLVGNGVFTITISVKDAAGNIGTCTNTFTVTDVTVPVITTCASNVTIPATSGCGAVMPNVTGAVVATDNCTATGSLVITQSPAAGTAIPAGPTTVTITVKDAANNITTCTTTVTVTDQTVPVITTCASSVTIPATSGCGAVMPNVTGAVVATDNCTAAGSLVITQSPAAGAAIPAGPTTVTITVKDAANNTTTCTAVVTVTDQTVPVITTCAPNVTIPATAGCGAVMPNRTGSVVATDNCTAAGSLVITQSPAAGTAIPAGPTTVTITVKDAANNITTCTTTVTVTDQTVPVITTCASNVTIPATSGCGAVMPNVTGGVVATDNCTAAGSLVITQSPAAGAAIPAGPTTVTITVKDAANNTTTCTAVVTVTDQTVPVITTCAPSVTIPTSSTSCTGTMPSLTTGVVATDNCTAAGSLVITQSPAAGATLPLGPTTVTITVKDAANNSTTCTTIVTVTDQTAPTVNCPPSITPAINQTGCVANVTTLDPTVTDNCTVASVTYALTGATTGTSAATGINFVGNHNFNVGVTTVTYTVKDAAGNTSTCSYTVTVTNTLAGAISGTATVQQNTNTTSNITFTGSGGTGPYTFTYNVRANGGAAGSNQTITTTNTSVTTVPQSNAVNGQYIYTLVSVTDVYGCTGTIPTDNKDTITIVTTLATPDFTPAMDIDQLALASNTSTDFVIYISEVKNASSTGQVVFRIPRTTAFPITFNTASGTSNVSGGTPNQNADWTITQNALFITCTLKPGVVIPPLGTSVIGFTVSRPAGTGSNTTYNINSTILNGTGGDSVNTNNSSTTTIIAQ
jgi:hypothetical protein